MAPGWARLAETLSEETRVFSEKMPELIHRVRAGGPPARVPVRGSAQLLCEMPHDVLHHVVGPTSCSRKALPWPLTPGHCWVLMATNAKVTSEELLKWAGRRV